MNNEMIEKRITQKTYHHLISCYGKEKIDQYFNTKIKKEFQEGISLKEIWKKYGYYLAKSKKNLVSTRLKCCSNINYVII